MVDASQKGKATLGHRESENQRISMRTDLEVLNSVDLVITTSTKYK